MQVQDQHQIKPETQSCQTSVTSSLFWHDAKKELPKRTKGNYSDNDVFVCQMYKYTIGRTYNNKWIDTKNEDLEDVILWAYIPKIPEDMRTLFDCL